VTSTIARGRVTGYDTAAAEKVPGLVAVLTPRNIGPLKSVPRDLIPGDRPPLELRAPLADDRVQHVGQAVAVVVAETFEAATFAASRVKVLYAAEEPVLDPDRADATAFEPEKFAGREEMQIHRGDVNKGLADAAVRVEGVYHTPVEHHHPIEPAATVAVWDGDALRLHDSSRFVHGVKKVAAAVFGLPAENVRVSSPFVGGAFGSKGFTWQHNLLAAAAARQVKRPVKLVLTRAQMFTLAGRRPETRQAVTLGAARDGRLTALRHRTTTETSTLADFIEPCGTLSKHLYSCPNIEIGHRIVHLNRASPVFMRAPGETPGSFALESAMDELAVAAGIDPVELRLRNHADRDEQEDKPWSSKHLKECYRIAAERFGWARRDPRPRAMRDGRLLVGWGMATAAYPGNRMEASAKVRLMADGRAVASSGTHEIGNGAYTVMALIAADALGLPAERVRFELGDTILPFAPAAGGSWSTASVGPAVIAAAEGVKAKLIQMTVADRASPLSGAAADQIVARDGELVNRQEEGKRDKFTDILSRAGKKEIEAEASSGPGEERKKFSFLSFGAHFVEVKVDPDLPAVRVTRVVSAFDPGAVLNPKAARSQMLGGITMGLGQALLEHTVYDPRTGAVVNPDLADYLLPVNADVPMIDVAFINEPDRHFNPMGGRGLGELGVPGVAAAVANAVFHATGKRVRELPITVDKVL
ncbi:MAG: xanthine dehydrogenase family protein molybdopterin-binding subunit, partial [Zavarzinella sp.]|nr:xanthine dehydrogenase family protein molybdopterin-binding subunit [Zavarzinella sp.]